MITLVWHSMGLIGNGGFEYLLGADFQGDPGFIYTAAAFKEIGAERAYRCFQEALACFPGNQPQEDLEVRRAHYAAAPEAVRSRINEAFWDGKAEATAGLAAYIRRHRDAVKQLLLAQEGGRG